MNVSVSTRSLGALLWSELEFKVMMWLQNLSLKCAATGSGIKQERLRRIRQRALLKVKRWRKGLTLSVTRITRY